MATGNYWERIERQRVSRRRLLATAGFGGAGLVVAAACGGSKSTGGSPSSGTVTGTDLGGTPTVVGEPKRGGRFQGMVPGDWGTIDPETSVGNATGILPRMYNTLFSRSNVQTDFIFMDLAESMEHPDDVTYTFKIRPGVKIAPNNLNIPERDMDAYDAKAVFDRAREDPESIVRAFTEPSLASHQAPDAQTLVLNLKTPYAYFMSRLGRALGGTIPPREFWEQKISLKDQGVGAGPFFVRPGSFEEAGGVILDANPNYYRKDERTGQQLPYIDGIDVARITEQQAQRTAFLSKQTSGQYTAQTINEVNELQKQESGIYFLKNPVFTFISFTMNVTKDPWQDDRIRKAALYALDRSQFVDLIVGNGQGRANGLVHWPCGAYALSDDELQQLQPYDPKRSKDLIKAATGQDTVKIKLSYPVTSIEFHDRHLPIFLQQMKDAGFDIDQAPNDFGSWLADYTKLRYDASLSPNQVYETSEIVLDWQSSKGPAQDGNFSVGVGSLYPEVDQALVDSRTAKDTNEHIQKVHDVQKMIYEKGPNFLPIMSWYSYTGYWKFVKNIPSMLGDTGTFLSNWWLDQQ